jgi:oxygen-independent coproporphyrinogen III oxidase
MAGIYIHIPYCTKACNYCNFHFSTNTKNIDLFIKTLLVEIEARKLYLDEPIETIYFGGGTPSILSATQLFSILNQVYQHYTVVSNAEITLEVNPENVNKESISHWKNIGINRLSMGIQSFFEDELQFMNRTHNAQQAQESLHLIHDYFNNYSIDLIFGSQLQSIDKLQTNLDIICTVKPPHISCYALTVEDKTALAHLIKNNNLLEPSQQVQHQGFYLIKDYLESFGYEHYEISNYSLPGFESKHNSNYWKGIPYLGFGPSAHSYNKLSRSWNVANNALYINAINNLNTILETEYLTPNQFINEFIMIGLRTKNGISLNDLLSKTTTKQFQQIQKKLEHYKKEQLINITDTHISLTKQGLIFADGIAADLFVD